MRRIGSKFIGSNQVMTSVESQEIIPPAPSNWTMPHTLYKFSLMNYNDCTLIVNEEVELFLKANQGFNTNEVDARIFSVKIKESGVQYNWIGAY